MEDKSTTRITNEIVAIIPSITTPTTTTNGQKPTINGEKKKKRGAFNLLKTALFMLRHRPSGKSKSIQVEVATNGNWKKIVGAMRPLHLQDNPSPPPPQILAVVNSPTVEKFEDVLPPASPAFSSTSAGTMSQYASANNLQELDKHDEESDDESDADFDENSGDVMIDAKAEEFIAHFYEQMRLQHHGRHRRHE